MLFCSYVKNHLKASSKLRRRPRHPNLDGQNFKDGWVTWKGMCKQFLLQSWCFIACSTRAAEPRGVVVFLSCKWPRGGESIKGTCGCIRILPCFGPCLLAQQNDMKNKQTNKPTTTKPSTAGHFGAKTGIAKSCWRQGEVYFPALSSAVGDTETCVLTGNHNCSIFQSWPLPAFWALPRAALLSRSQGACVFHPHAINKLCATDI